MPAATLRSRDSIRFACAAGSASGRSRAAASPLDLPATRQPTTAAAARPRRPASGVPASRKSRPRACLHGFFGDGHEQSVRRTVEVDVDGDLVRRGPAALAQTPRRRAGFAHLAPPAGRREVLAGTSGRRVRGEGADLFGGQSGQGGLRTGARDATAVERRSLRRATRATVCAWSPSPREPQPRARPEPAAPQPAVERAARRWRPAARRAPRRDRRRRHRDPRRPGVLPRQRGVRRVADGGPPGGQARGGDRRGHSLPLRERGPARAPTGQGAAARRGVPASCRRNRRDGPVEDALAAEAGRHRQLLDLYRAGSLIASDPKYALEGGGYDLVARLSTCATGTPSSSRSTPSASRRPATPPAPKPRSTCAPRSRYH